MIRYRSCVARELVYREQPDTALTELENDPNRADLLANVDDVLARLSLDIADPVLRTVTLSTQVSHLVIKSTEVESYDWRVLWSTARSEEEVEIIYIGPVSGA